MLAQAKEWPLRPISTRHKAFKKLRKSKDEGALNGARLHLSLGFKIALKFPIPHGRGGLNVAMDVQKALLRYMSQGACTAEIWKDEPVEKFETVRIIR